MIIRVKKHDYSCSKTRLFLLKQMIILVQKHDYYVKKHDYSCLKTRLFLLKNTIIISGCTESNAKTCTRCDDFYVQIVIDVNKCKRQQTIGRKPRLYFGEVIFYFRYTQQGFTKLLTLIKVWEVKMSVDHVPYQRKKANHRYIVVSVGGIHLIATIYTSTSKRRYIVWPMMNSLQDEEPGLLNDLY